MDGVLSLILLALFPAIGNFIGGIIAEFLPPSKKILNLSLHAATGIILAIVSIEIMPTALTKAPPLLIALMFVAGGCVYLAIRKGIEHYAPKNSSAWMIYLATGADLFGDGLLIGSGSAISHQLAFILALGQVLADLPEGFAVIANFRDKGMEWKKRLVVSVSFVIPILIATLASYFLLREQNETVKIAGLVFVAGLFCLAAVEDMLKEAHQTIADSGSSAISFLLGFALFIVITGYF